MHQHSSAPHDLTLLPVAQVPVAVACSAPEARVQPVLEATGLAPALEAVVTAEDVYRGRPDPEAYLLAAQRLQRPPVRCVVVGNSNQVCCLFILMFVLCGRSCCFSSVCLSPEHGRPLSANGTVSYAVCAWVLVISH